MFSGLGDRAFPTRMVDVGGRMPRLVRLPDQKKRSLKDGTLRCTAHVWRSRLSSERHAPCLKRQHVPKSTSVQAFHPVRDTRCIPIVRSSVRVQHRTSSSKETGGRHPKPLADRQFEPDVQTPRGCDGDAPDGAKVVDQHDVHGLTLGPGYAEAIAHGHLDGAGLRRRSWCWNGPFGNLSSRSWCGFCPNANACVQTQPCTSAALAPRKNLVVMNGEEQGHVSANVGHTDRHRSTSTARRPSRCVKPGACCAQAKAFSRSPEMPMKRSLSSRRASFITTSGAMEPSVSKVNT